MGKTTRKYVKSKKFHPFKAKREKLGVSRTDLASYLGIGWQTLWRWETLRTAPRPAALARAWKEGLMRLSK